MITTEVDALLALVEQRKRLSLDDTAKELRLSPSTVEKLATFLEEEGLLEIKYQLTTPYLVWKVPENKAEKREKTEKQQLPMPYHVPSSALPPLKEERRMESLDESKEAIRDVYTLISQEKVKEAKELYQRIHAQYESLPRTYIATRKEMEQELVKLNTELSTIVDRNAAAKVRDAKAKIEGLLEQGNKLMKTRDWKMTAKVYNEIKSIYRSMPAGFIKEKTELSERVLTFYELLSSLHHEQTKKDMADCTADLNILLEKIRQAMASQQFSQAISLYNEAKEKYAALPHGFLEQKLEIQERMLLLFRDLTIAKKTYTVSELHERAEAIARFLEQINDCMAKGDVEKALVHYKHVKELYEGLPAGFLAEQSDIHAGIIRTYKRLIKARREHSITSVKFGSSKINDFVAKAKHYLTTNEHDLAFQMYREIIDEYNILPEGYADEKAFIRNIIYDLYYQMVSTADIVQMGYLDDYTKERYFGLLKLLVTMHKVIDSGEFPLLPELYVSIHRMYNELPLKVVQHHGKLVQEVNRAYSLIRIHDAVQQLDTLKNAGKYDELRQTLGFLGIELVRASKESPEDKVLLTYAKDRYMRYMEFVEGKREEIPPATIPGTLLNSVRMSAASSLVPESAASKAGLSAQTPQSASRLLAKEERLYENITREKQGLHNREQDIRFRLDQLTQCKQLYEQAQQHYTQRNYNEAIIALGQLLAIDQSYPNARTMMNTLEKLKMQEYRKELLASLVKTKKEKAIVCLAEHDYGGAVAYIQSILELDPTNVEAQYMLQTARAETGR